MTISPPTCMKQNRTRAILISKCGYSSSANQEIRLRNLALIASASENTLMNFGKSLQDIQIHEYIRNHESEFQPSLDQPVYHEFVDSTDREHIIVYNNGDISPIKSHDKMVYQNNVSRGRRAQRMRNNNPPRRPQRQQRQQTKAPRKQPRQQRRRDRPQAQISNVAGSYVRQAPLATSTSLIMPQRRSTTFRVVRTEYVLTVYNYTANNFAITAKPINPGFSDAFPWLSQIALSYEYYRVNSITWKYIPTCNATTNGQVLLSFDTDSADETPQNKSQMSENDPFAMTSAWSGTILPLRKSHTSAHNNGKLLNRDGNVPANYDINLYDLGRLYVATEGVAANTAVGDVWVDYDIDFMIPQQNNDIPSHYSLWYSNGTASVLFNVNGNIYSNSRIAVLLGTNNIQFNCVGTFLVVIGFDGDSATEISASTVDLNKMSITQLYTQAADRNMMTIWKVNVRWLDNDANIMTIARSVSQSAPATVTVCITRCDQQLTG
jgi:hypothetical protein